MIRVVGDGGASLHFAPGAAAAGFRGVRRFPLRGAEGAPRGAVRRN